MMTFMFRVLLLRHCTLTSHDINNVKCCHSYANLRMKNCWMEFILLLQLSQLYFIKNISLLNSTNNLLHFFPQYYIILYCSVSEVQFILFFHFPK